MTQLSLLSQPRTVARPLRVLVPLIQDDLRHGNSAGMAYYRHAGDKLREARPQVSAHRWTQFLTANFAISKTTAWRYMRASEIHEAAQASGDRFDDETLADATGEAPKRKARRRQQRKVLDAIGDVDVDHVAQAADSRQQETELHRSIAADLIDIGYKALAMRFHPDRGGSRDAMRRLNRVREELTSVAKIRRFE
jgi:hypothetical protein